MFGTILLFCFLHLCILVLFKANTKLITLHKSLDDNATQFLSYSSFDIYLGNLVIQWGK